MPSSSESADDTGHVVPTDPAAPSPTGEPGRMPSTGAAASAATGASAHAAPETSGTRFVFIDTEATGLDHERHELTEVSWIVRFEDGTEAERQFFPVHTLDGADEGALEITHYHERIASQQTSPASEWLTTFLDDAQGAVLVGAVPDFDARHLERAARKVQRTPTWDHHLLDVETLALPLIAPGPEAPRSLAATCAALGIPHDRDKAHGALYDARQAMRVFDAVWERLAELRKTASPLPEAVPRRTHGTQQAVPADATSEQGAGAAAATAAESSGTASIERHADDSDQSGTSTASSRM